MNKNFGFILRVRGSEKSDGKRNRGLSSEDDGSKDRYEKEGSSDKGTGLREGEDSDTRKVKG